ncbi:MAG: MerR family transcriptional regulator [Thermomicrobiales bacterium]|nr:MerR family transcriptional regulator [Thermomicrobiales bacterium]
MQLQSHIGGSHCIDDRLEKDRTGMSDAHDATPSITYDHSVGRWASDAAPFPARRLYLTSDLRAATGLPRTHMDYYLREGIIRPTARTESGYLLFDEAELETLRAVLRWREAGVGIKEIRIRLGRATDA